MTICKKVDSRCSQSGITPMGVRVWSLKRKVRLYLLAQIIGNCPNLIKYTTFLILRSFRPLYACQLCWIPVSSPSCEKCFCVLLLCSALHCVMEVGLIWRHSACDEEKQKEIEKRNKLWTDERWIDYWKK